MSNFIINILFNTLSNISSNLVRYFVSLLIILQYFGSNGDLLDSGFNHTLLLQTLACIASLPFFYHLNKKNTLILCGVSILFVFFSAIHYEIVSRINDYSFNFYHLWVYVKFQMYLFVYLALYYFFEGKDFQSIIKVTKLIVLVLFFESLIYLTFNILGLVALAEFFKAGSGRFAGIFLMHNTLVGLFALFLMSYVVYYGRPLEKYLYLVIGIYLITLTGERSLALGLVFFLFSNILFSYDKNDKTKNNKVTISIFFSVLIISFVVLYTIFIRGHDIQSFGEFLRPLTIRIYYSYLSTVHLFESNSSVFGFGPFIANMPLNFYDIHSDYVQKFINIVGTLFGEIEKAYLIGFHDSINFNSDPRYINAHNTFVDLFFKFGYFFIVLLFFLAYTLFISFYHVKNNPKKFLLLQSYNNEKIIKKEFFFLPSSLTFIISSFPSLLFLSLDNYLVLVIIALGLIGSYSRHG